MLGYRLRYRLMIDFRKLRTQLVPRVEGMDSVILTSVQAERRGMGIRSSRFDLAQRLAVTSSLIKTTVAPRQWGNASPPLCGSSANCTKLQRSESIRLASSSATTGSCFSESCSPLNKVCVVVSICLYRP